MPSLSDSDRSALLDLAHQAVVEAVSGRTIPEIPTEGVFAEKRGVFVTLHVQHQLRGCIGVVEAQEPLGEAIVRCAASAALQDPRFPPLSIDELHDLEIELSLLSAPAPIRPEGIEIGRHGLFISRGRQRGLLLPQFAIEHQLTTEQFLRDNCRKAQLPSEALRESDTTLLGFTCEVFSDALSPHRAKP